MNIWLQKEYISKYPDQFRYDYAISREQKNAAGQKMYIQTKMAEYAEELWELMQDEKTHIYMCGLKGMESGMAECFTPIAEKYGKDWAEFAKAMKKADRYHVEALDSLTFEGANVVQGPLDSEAVDAACISPRFELAVSLAEDDLRGGAFCTASTKVWGVCHPGTMCKRGVSKQEPWSDPARQRGGSAAGWRVGSEGYGSSIAKRQETCEYGAGPLHLDTWISEHDVRSAYALFVSAWLLEKAAGEGRTRDPALSRQKESQACDCPQSHLQSLEACPLTALVSHICI
eukprot:s6326_g1.t3